MREKRLEGGFPSTRRCRAARGSIPISPAADRARAIGAKPPLGETHGTPGRPAAHGPFARRQGGRTLRWQLPPANRDFGSPQPPLHGRPAADPIEPMFGVGQVSHSIMMWPLLEHLTFCWNPDCSNFFNLRAACVRWRRGGAPAARRASGRRGAQQPRRERDLSIRSPLGMSQAGFLNFRINLSL